MNDLEEALIKALALASPGIGRWLGGLIAGSDTQPERTRRVADILPERSASQSVVDELEAQRGR